MIQDFLTESAKKVMKDTFGVTDIDIRWEFPRESTFGDLASSVALSVSKSAGKSPRDIAEAIVKNISTVKGVAKAEVAGAGYVNVWLTPEALIARLAETRKACVPAVKRKGKRPVIVEYSQPNIAKPLGVHHLLSTMIGQCLANIYRHQGYETISINHLGDWGTQFGKLAVALKKWGTKPVRECTLDDLLDLYVRFHEEAEKDAALEDEARETFRKIEAGDKELRGFWKDVVEITMGQINLLYKRLHVSFDHVHGESFYEDKMKPIIEEGKKKKVFVEGQDGALIVEFPEASKLPPAIVIKGDGATIYLTRDLATVEYRVSTWHPEAILYVVDVAQSLYFQQLFATVQKLGWDLPHLEHVVVGRMRFADRSMSTRKGNILRLREFLDESVTRATAVIKEHGEGIHTDDPEALAEMMGIGAVVYGIVSQNRRMDMVFDLEKFLSFEGNSAPYLQYTHARAKSVLGKAGDIGSVKDIAELSDAERALINMLLKFAVALEEARATHMPHTLANFLYSLCQQFNAFYNAEPILKAPEPQKALRLHLTELTATVLKTGASLLTLSVPDRM